jgi:hypothetical protein
MLSANLLSAATVVALVGCDPVARNANLTGRHCAWRGFEELSSAADAGTRNKTKGHQVRTVRRSLSTASGCVPWRG